MKPLYEQMQATKMAFDSFIMIQDPGKNHVDILSNSGITLKESLIDFKDMIMLIQDSYAPNEVA